MRRNIKPRSTFLLLGVTMFVLMGGWAIGADQTPKVLPKTLTFATNPIGSMQNSVGTGLASVMSKHLPTLVKVMPTTGTREWFPMTATGEVDMGILNSWDAKMGRLGRGDYKAATAGKGAPIYLLTSGCRARNGVVVAESSGIKKGTDLKGKRYVGVFTGSAGITAQATAALANWELKTTDVRMINVPGVEAGVRAIIEGHADGTGSTSIGMGVIAELDAGKGARYLSFDPSPEAVKRMQEYFPCSVVQIKPAPGLIGVREPIYVSTYDFYCVASEKLSDYAAYCIVKTLWEYDKELAPIHVMLKDWTRDRYVTTNATIPYHPGAINFYKEIGAWKSEMDNLQRQLLGEK